MFLELDRDTNSDELIRIGGLKKNGERMEGGKESRGGKQHKQVRMRSTTLLALLRTLTLCSVVERDCIEQGKLGKSKSDEAERG